MHEQKLYFEIPHPRLKVPLVERMRKRTSLLWLNVYSTLTRWFSDIWCMKTTLAKVTVLVPLGTLSIWCGFKLRIIVEDIIDDMKMVIFHWPFTLLWHSDFLRFDDWKKPLAKVAVLVPLGALFAPGAPVPNLTNLDRFGPVSKCISAYYNNVWAFSGQKC